MAKTKRLTYLVAGRVWSGVCYTAVLPSDTGQQRAAKINVSSAARQKINLTKSWQKLEVVLSANFTYSDLFVTLTYDDDHLPPSRAAAIRILKKFITQLRAERRKHGQELKYIYVTESKTEEGRLHHHIVINGTGQDYELIRALWTHGTNLQFSQIDSYGYTELARYMTKEAREAGSPNGARTWVPSRGLIHPKPHSEWVDENLDITPPPGAIILEAEPPKINVYGSYSYYKYLLPEPKARRSRPKNPKLKKDVSFSDLGHCISSEKGQRNQQKERLYVANQGEKL